MAPRTGRPPKENPRNISLNIRLTVDEAELIQEASKLFNCSRTDAIILGVRSVLKSAIKK